jgi:hypothetical protein
LPAYYEAVICVFFLDWHWQQRRATQFFAGAPIRDTPDTDAAVAPSFCPVRHLSADFILSDNATGILENVGIGKHLYREIDIRGVVRRQCQTLAVEYEIHQ